jgi:hypothetical protein
MMVAVGLLDALQDFITPAFARQAAACLNESPEHTERAVRMAVPAIIRGLIEWASVGGGAEQLLSMISRAATRVDLAALPGPADLIPCGRGLPSAIFCTSFASVIDRLATASGLRAASTSSLLSLLTPIVLAIIAREIAAERFTAAGFSAWLVGQREEMTPFLPAGLGHLIAQGNHMTSSAFANPDHLDVLGALDALANAHASPPPPTFRLSYPAPRWAVPALILVLVALFAWFLAAAWD